MRIWEGVALLALGVCLSGCDTSVVATSAVPRVAPGPLPEQPGTGAHYALSPWASVHRDSSNSDYVPLSPHADVEPWWTALEGASLFVGPIFGPEGHIYVPSGRGMGHSNLHAYSADGRLLWETPVMQSMDDFDYGAVVSAPIVDSEGRVYANDRDQLWSFTADGALRWVAALPEHGIEGFFVTPVFSREGWVGGVSTDGKVAFFDRETGALAVPVLTLESSKGLRSAELPPGIWQNGLVAEAFHQELWDLLYGRNMAVSNTPAVHPDSGRIFITVAAVDPAQGVLIGIDTDPAGLGVAFTAPMGGGSGTSPAISPDGRLVYAIDDAGLMVALDAKTGQRVWEAPDTMGQASPSIGPDGTVYSFNGVAGTIVAIDGDSGAVKWRRDYHPVAEHYLGWHPLAERKATVDGIITVTDSGLWAFLDLCYEIGDGADAYPQPRKVVVAQIDAATGEVLGTFESRDSSGAFVVPDAAGNFYLTLSATATSIAYYGVNPRLPFFLRNNFKPVAGLVALKPRAQQ
ncbi:MAG: PQQ-binding-like beta-propeller repeat protein [Spongiibacteraceae bacterium]|jgi:outer membrane protein assembly factor BamB|nr:PQQ-binding-like beta-propeller repeat protein [Spongiibacteraceae bacterium]